MCDAAVQALVTDRRGHPLYLRRRRTVLPAQMCALWVRKGDHCVFHAVHRPGLHREMTLHRGKARPV
jgi:hypothetical protein